MGRYQLAGTLMGLCGTVVLVAGTTLSYSSQHVLGYVMAIAAAVVWALYSLLTKRLPAFPTAAVGGFCLTSGIIALLIVAGRENTVHDLYIIQTHDWLWLLAMGMGPLGIAFYCWDAALKHGEPAVIAAVASPPAVDGLAAGGVAPEHPYCSAYCSSSAVQFSADGPGERVQWHHLVHLSGNSRGTFSTDPIKTCLQAVHATAIAVGNDFTEARPQTGLPPGDAGGADRSRSA